MFAVELIDRKLKVDDPVGAISVHGVSGALGTIMVGLFAKEGGLFYGGGFELLITQIIGVVVVFIWAFSLGFLLFKLIKVTIGVRVSRSEEEKGLDITEHGEEIYN